MTRDEIIAELRASVVALDEVIAAQSEFVAEQGIDPLRAVTADGAPIIAPLIAIRAMTLLTLLGES